MMIKFLPSILLALLTFGFSWQSAEVLKVKQELKQAKAEIELIGNFCADSIPPKVMDNGRGSEKNGTSREN